MIGKASAIQVHTEYSDWAVNQWLRANPNALIIDIKYSFVEMEKEGFMIVYREGDSNG